MTNIKPKRQTIKVGKTSFLVGKSYKSQTKPVKSQRQTSKMRFHNSRYGDDILCAQDKTDTILEAIKKEYWKLKYADGSSAKHLFKSHNKSLDRIKQILRIK